MIQPSLQLYAEPARQTFSNWFQILAESRFGEDAPLFYVLTDMARDVWSGVSLREFCQRVMKCAGALDLIGIPKGAVVAFMAEGGIEWEIFNLACLIKGLVVVGIDSHATIDQKAYIFAQAGPAVLLVDDLSRLDEFDQTELGLRHIVTLRTPKAARYRDANIHAYESLLAQGVFARQYDISPEDPAMLIFTSGTTSLPKCISYTQKQVLLAIYAISTYSEENLARARDHVTVSWMPLSNIYQRMLNLSAIDNRFKIYYCPKPTAIMRYLPSIRPTVFTGVPRLFEKIVLEANRTLLKVPRPLRTLMADFFVKPIIRRKFGGRIEILVCGSAKLPLFVLDFFESLGLPIYEAYGMSENIIPIAANSKAYHLKGSVGKVMPLHQVKIDSEGEFFLKSPGAGKITGATVIDEDGWLRTGDIGKLDENGFLFIEGRKDNVIKTSSGIRVSSEYLEQKFLGAAAAEQVVVIGNNRKVLGIILVSVATPAYVATEVARINADLPRRYRICGVLLARKPFTIDSGFVTPNLKIKRLKIERELSASVDLLYQDIESLTAESEDIVMPAVRELL